MELALLTTPSNHFSSLNEGQLEIEHLLGTDDDPPQDSTQYSALLAFEDYLRRDDDPPQELTQHYSVLLDPFEDYTGEVPTSQSLGVPVSTSQSLQNVSNQQHIHAQQYQSKPTPLQSLGHNHQIIRLPTPPNKRQKISSQRCGCKVNKCQKGYCGCYAAGELCGENCSCQGCFNKSEYEATEKRNNNMGHNPQAMYGAPTLNPFAPSSAVNIASMARRQANSFTTSSNITPPQAVQTAMMAQQQANSFTTSSNISPPQVVQMATIAQANPFVPSSNISPSQAVQMATIAQANPFVPSSNISPPQAVQMAFMAQPQA